MNSGVPQGSIPGPLLYVCYINDLPKFCADLLPFIYADDTALLSRCKSMDKITENLQIGFDSITSWFGANKLEFNISKTKSMLFTGKRSPYRNFNLDIKSNNTSIESPDNFKYLWVTLDKNLTFEQHISNTIKKVSQRTRVLWKVRNYVSQDLARYLYLTLVHSLFTYCDFVYDGCTSTQGNKLQVAQNSALRAVRNCKYDYSTTKLHNDLQIDDLQTYRRKSTLKLV